MLNQNNIKSVFLVGIGGIGMSALARYFHFEGKNVAGYDKTPTVLTGELQKEGMTVLFDDDIEVINEIYKNKEQTLVIYTPAIPSSHTGLTYFKENGFTILKRAEVLGLLTRSSQAICIAGTHGKTTTSTLTAHLLKQSAVECSAFLGGIAQNYQTNLLLSHKSNYVVLEADEFDRSFLQLTPHFAVITSADADHLDIYGDADQVRDAFEAFTNRIKGDGVLVMKKGIAIQPQLVKGCKLQTYALDDKSADYYAKDIVLDNGLYGFTFVSPQGEIKNLKLGVPGLVNVENSVAALAMALLSGVSGDEMRTALESFKGIRRRFEYRIKSEHVVFIDDYAHHPEEIKATLNSVRAIYGSQRLTGVFQPHLYSRTNDFAIEFAKSLELLDEVILLDIYPARELPIEGVTSEIIFNQIEGIKKMMCRKEALVDVIDALKPEVLITMGAGDIDKLVPQIENKLKETKSDYRE